MAYIRFDITSELTDERGRLSASISRLRGDNNGSDINELNIIFHALSLLASVRESVSCYGAGYWQGEKPWLGNDVWKG